MEAMSGEFGVALPWGLLYADGLPVVAETEEELIERRGDGVEGGGMRVNMNEAGVVMGGERRRVEQRAVGWPCGVCGEGVGGGSLQCAGCQRWVHRPQGVRWYGWWHVEGGEVLHLWRLLGFGDWCGSRWCGCWGKCRVGVGGWVLLPGWHAGCGW